MPHRIIKIKKAKVRPHKSFMAPDFDAPTVLVADMFDYVGLWLKRYSNAKAQLLWQQSRNFYSASMSMPNESKAITSYYCILNASKALLEAKNLKYSQLHGVSGESIGKKASLQNEIISVKGKGVFVELNKYYGSSVMGVQVSLKDLLYNLPFVHRAYTVTYRGSQELFIPIKDAHYVRQGNGPEAWLCAEISDSKYCDKKVMSRQRGWEIDQSESGKFVIRRKRRFKWDTRRGITKKERMTKLVEYHQKIRRDLRYIQGLQRLWYYKRNDRAEGILHWPTPSLTFAAMHRMSELTRYDPKKLQSHFDSQHNWLLTEFMNQAAHSFVDQIASDITGHELMLPGYR